MLDHFEKMLVDAWVTENEVKSVGVISDEGVEFSYAGCDILQDTVPTNVVGCIATDANNEIFDLDVSEPVLDYLLNECQAFYQNNERGVL